MKILNVDFVKTKSEKVVARADVHFEGFLLKGFKVLFDNETHKNYVTPPSYLGGGFWRPLFKTDSPEDWNMIQTTILRNYEDFEMKAYADEAFGEVTK